MDTELKTRTFFSKNSYLLVAAAWLITISFIIDNYWSGTSTLHSVQNVLQQSIQESEKDFIRVSSDTIVTNKLLSRDYQEGELEHLVQKKYFLFIYKGSQKNKDFPVFWNTQVIEPSDSIINLPSSTGFIKLANGYYYFSTRVQPAASGEMLVWVALIPVKWDYYIHNQYLKNSLVALPGIEKEYSISSVGGDAAIHNLEGKTVFYISRSVEFVIVHNNTLAIILRILASLLVLFFIHITATHIIYRKGLWQGILVLVIPVLLLRVISYMFPIPLHFRQFELFDPSIYGSNFILRSLGDLLINSLLLAWMIMFIRYHLQELNRPFIPKTRASGLVMIIVASVILILFTLIFGHITRNLVADSQISFDVINFSTLKIYSVLGFVVLACLATAYFYICQILMYFIGYAVNGRYVMLYLVITILSLIFLTFNIKNPLARFDLLLLCWLLLYTFLLNYNYLTLLASRLVSSRIVFWIVFFSISITVIIVIQNKDKELAERKEFAENLYSKSDPSMERSMGMIMTDFRNDKLSDLFPRFKDQAANKLIKDSLLSNNPSGYANKYDTKIYTFNAAELPLFNEDETNFRTLNTIVETMGKPTTIPGLLYYDIAYNKFNYISKKDVRDTSGYQLGYVFIVSHLRKNKSDALYPELFSKGNVNSIESSPIYGFAIYDKNELVNNHNDYSFPTRLMNMKLALNEYRSVTKNGYDELWYRPNEDKVVVIVKQENFFLETMTLFAYMFCVFLAVVALFWILNILIRGRFNIKKVRSLWQITIRNQVHGTIIFISVLSFVIIGVATILFFINRYHTNNRERLSTTIQVMQNEVRNSFEKLSVFDDAMSIFDLMSNQKLDEIIMNISEIHSTDVNLYDLDGNLRSSSIALPYNKGIVSKKMDPIAFYHLSSLKEVQYFKEQQIGKLNYLSDYVPVRDNSGREYAYLNIPYFESESKLKEEISNFLVTIINLNAFIFLVGGIVALFITNRITHSFSLISDKMKKVHLGKINEEIIWNQKDEIGELVLEYNKMVKKLDTSAELLARSEREGAWREMARQVAHEIKNPLTPMKLSLQFLQNAINSNNQNVREMTIRVTKTLVEQIDHLSNIASDFSQFANIGQNNNEVIDIVDSIDTVIALFSTTDSVHIAWVSPETPIWIYADKTQINRLFTNLLQNAIQSVPENVPPEILITAETRGAKLEVSIRDNGSGISDAVRGKIFTPNFTTKTSGTGLGLAMCKGIVEQAKGNIWFETKEGIGTIFYIELPIVTLDEN